METQINKNKFSFFNIMDIIKKALWPDKTRNFRSARIAEIKVIRKKEIKTRIPENPAYYYQLGWRKDA